MGELAAPDLLLAMVASGRWPKDEAAVQLQNLEPAVQGDAVRAMAAEEDHICLFAPPLASIARLMRQGEASFWEELGALDEISPERSLVIGDFGLGSDSPIILSYDQDLTEPRILRLRWEPLSRETHWVEMARTFDEFVTGLGL